MQSSLEHDQQTPHVHIEASARPTLPSLLPDSDEPETRRQRLGQHRNGAYKEKVKMREVDPQAQKERNRTLVTLGLEVGLAVMLTLAARLWGWAREERARARADRALRRRIPAT
ncbi:MAG: hypothetical protein ACHQ1E_02330 [Ktedonobacterales bacterium]|jgi:hypothetical protein